MKNDAHLKPFSEALEDHSAEGIAILTAEPWRFTRLTLYTILALVVGGLLWSFFGHADVIVSTQGTLVPESEVRRMYTPVDGELANLYIAEGQPVSERRRGGAHQCARRDRGRHQRARGAAEAGSGRARMARIPRTQGPAAAARRDAEAADGAGRAPARTARWPKAPAGWAKASGRNCRKRAPISRMRAARATPPATRPTSSSGCWRCPAAAACRSCRSKPRRMRCRRRRTRCAWRNRG